MDESIISADARILVTGANGFIGTRVVETLLGKGMSNLRCFVRPSSKLEHLDKVLKKFPKAANIEYFRGDMLSPDHCKAAVRGASIIIHLAAGFEKSLSAVFMSSVAATRVLLDAFLDNGSPKRFVQVSSFAVYSNLKMKRGAVLDENSPLEDHPEDRHDAYGFGKLKQEELVREYGRLRSLPYVIVRPGAVFGPGKPELSGRLGFRAKKLFFRVGGSNQAPLTYVDNCADAIVLAALKREAAGDIFNVVDDDLPSTREFLCAYRKHTRLFCVPVPYFAAYSFCALCERASRFIKPLKRFNRRRCAADWKGNRFSNQKLRERLGWTPRVPMNEAMQNFLAQFGQKMTAANERANLEPSKIGEIASETV